MTTFIGQDSIANLCTHPGELPTELLEALSAHATGSEVYDLALRHGVTAAYTRALYDQVAAVPGQRNLWDAARGHLTALGTGPALDSFVNELAQIWFAANAVNNGNNARDLARTIRFTMQGLSVTQIAYLVTSADVVAAAFTASFGELRPPDQLSTIVHIHRLLPDLPQYGDNRRETAAALTKVAISALRNADPFRGQLALCSATTPDTLRDFQMRHDGYQSSEIEHLLRICMLPALESETGYWSEYRTEATLEAVEQHGWHLSPELLARIAAAPRASESVRKAAFLPQAELVKRHKAFNAGNDNSAGAANARRAAAVEDLLQTVGSLDAHQWAAALQLIRLLPPETTYSQAAAVILTVSA